MAAVLIKGSCWVTSFMRILTLDTSSRAADQTYGTLNSTIWTTIEANTAIMCASLMVALAPLAAFFKKMFPRGISLPCISIPRIALPPSLQSSRQDKDTVASDRPRFLHRLRSRSRLARGSPKTTWDDQAGATLLEVQTRASDNTVPSDGPPSDYKAFEVDPNAIPLGRIAKTTHLNVAYSKDGEDLKDKRFF